MNVIKHFVNGQLFDGKSKRKGKVFNPATGEQSSEVNFATIEDVNVAVDAAKKLLYLGHKKHLYTEREYFLNLKN